MIFNENSNPTNVCNRVMKRLSLEGKVHTVPRTKDKTYLYMPKPTIINSRSAMINHCLKIVDYYIAIGCPKKCLIEPEFGCYEPDLFYSTKDGKTVCVEIQLTRISNKKMKEKVDNFVKTSGVEHDSKCLVIVSDHKYNVSVPKGFHIMKRSLPQIG